MQNKPIIIRLTLLMVIIVMSSRASWLDYMYLTTSGRLMRAVCRSSWISSLAGWYADSRLSRREIKRLIKNYHIDVSEAEKPMQEYRTLNDFFTRRLKPGVRPLAVDQFTAPTDGMLMVMTQVHEDAQFPIKQATFNLATFLQDPALAQSFYGGTMLIFRLAPGDYHRFHFPCDGRVTEIRTIHGCYESVNPTVYKAGVQALEVNERHLILMENNEFGEIVLVSVGAMCVGRITETCKIGAWYHKGDEAGYFSFGGSTLVVLCKKKTISLASTIIERSKNGLEYPIKMGASLSYLR